ncbi:phosphotransferase enzyme family protein [Taibaiella koreensis]|uniref:phosphotransferase enzyme family protein n=1 Tax=Taibaiella koreensis TaxID=1268548 RepID=UPI000E59ED1F|nr:phosphotransferase [Taibaiella koreensis]
MDIFPTQYSTLASGALNLRLQEAFGLKDTHCRLLIRNVSDAYVFGNEAAQYLFKIYRDAHRKPDEIRGEVQLLNALAAGGARVAQPVADRAGHYLQAFQAAEGIRYGVLFTWAPGEVVMAMDKTQLETVGREMARIHQISERIELDHHRSAYTPDTTIAEPLQRIEPAFKGLESAYAYLHQAGDEVYQQLSDMNTEAFSKGYCHYDFLPKNFHFTAAGAITFFDFDFAGKGLLANDIATFFNHFFLEVTAGRLTIPEAQEALAIFIAAYRRVKPLSDAEIQAIPALGFAFWTFYLGFQYDSYDDWSNFFFGPRFLRERTALIRKWMETAPALLP